MAISILEQFESSYPDSVRVLDGYVLELVLADEVQFDQIADEYVHERHDVEPLPGVMSSQESIQLIADYFDKLVRRVTKAQHMLKFAEEEQEAQHNPEPHKVTEAQAVVLLAKQHLTVEQAAMAEFTQRFRAVIAQE